MRRIYDVQGGTDGFELKFDHRENDRVVKNAKNGKIKWLPVKAADKNWRQESCMEKLNIKQTTNPDYIKIYE